MSHRTRKGGLGLAREFWEDRDQRSADEKSNGHFWMAALKCAGRMHKNKLWHKVAQILVIAFIFIWAKSVQVWLSSVRWKLRKAVHYVQKLAEFYSHACCNSVQGSNFFSSVVLCESWTVGNTVLQKTQFWKKNINHLFSCWSSFTCAMSTLDQKPWWACIGDCR